MKKLLFLAFAAMLSVPIFAQWSIGLSGGYAYNHYDYDPQYMSGLDYKGHHGFAIDVPVNYQFNDWFGLSTGLSFQQKGYMLNGSYYPSGSETSYEFYPMLRRNDSYFVLPLLSKFAYGISKWKVSVDIGIYTGFWCSSIFVFKEIETLSGHKISSVYMREPMVFEGKADRRIECGLIGGIGITRNISKRWSLTANARCYYAVTPQQKEYQIMHFPSRNTTSTAQIGILYHL